MTVGIREIEGRVRLPPLCWFVSISVVALLLLEWKNAIYRVFKQNSRNSMAGCFFFGICRVEFNYRDGWFYFAKRHQKGYIDFLTVAEIILRFNSLFPISFILKNNCMSVNLRRVMGVIRRFNSHRGIFSLFVSKVSILELHLPQDKGVREAMKLFFFVGWKQIPNCYWSVTILATWCRQAI